MSSFSCARLDELPAYARAMLDDARRGVLTTIGPDGTPHAVPVCFAIRDGEIISGIDAKPKEASLLGRVRNLERNNSVAFLIDRWDEDWTRLGWVMVRGIARLEEPGEDWSLLVARYAQYEDMPANDGLIVIRPRRISWWTWQ